VNFSPYQDGTGPELEGYTEITVNGRPAWIKTQQSMVPSDIGWSVYIQGPENWYNLHLSCRPPTGADINGQAAYHAQCEAVLHHILESFEVLSP
jgi:hypothetical protein